MSNSSSKPDWLKNTDEKVLLLPPYWAITLADFVITFTSILIGTTVAFGVTVVGLEEHVNLIRGEYLFEAGIVLFAFVCGFVVKLQYQKYSYRRDHDED
ncbi:hypothetical protein ABNG02_15745 [Halorubrum ejinorense]|uniref:Uncharacterized protein n=1 Tax=Halorubrum ejinorense TaxID=425309 RepID=A0AAV3SR22_9EURY